MADAFGRMLADYHADELRDAPIHRRDDGETWDAVLGWYFSPPEEWPPIERQFVDRAKGRVLDLGCGAGRTALYLQGKGHDVVGVDRSPRAVAVARDRGLQRGVVADMNRLGIDAEFDTILVVGGHLGQPGSKEGLRELLRGLGELAPDGRLIADLTDPTSVESRDRWQYLNENKVDTGIALRRFRVEYDDLEGPWIDLLFISPDALYDLLEETGWWIEDLERNGPQYYVTLSRE